MSQPGKFKGRIKHRQTNTLFTFQCNRGVLIPSFPDEKIALMLFTALIGKATAQYKRHFASTVGVLGDAATFSDAI